MRQLFHTARTCCTHAAHMLPACVHHVRTLAHLLRDFARLCASLRALAAPGGVLWPVSCPRTRAMEDAKVAHAAHMFCTWCAHGAHMARGRSPATSHVRTMCAPCVPHVRTMCASWPVSCPRTRAMKQTWCAHEAHMVRSWCSHGSWQVTCHEPCAHHVRSMCAC